MLDKIDPEQKAEPAMMVIKYLRVRLQDHAGPDVTTGGHGECLRMAQVREKIGSQQQIMKQIKALWVRSATAHRSS